MSKEKKALTLDQMEAVVEAEDLPYIITIDDGETHRYAARLYNQAVQVWDTQNEVSPIDIPDFRVRVEKWDAVLEIDTDSERGIVKQTAFEWAREFANQAPCLLCSSVY